MWIGCLHFYSISKSIWLSTCATLAIIVKHLTALVLKRERCPWKICSENCLYLICFTTRSKGLVWHIMLPCSMIDMLVSFLVPQRYVGMFEFSLSITTPVIDFEQKNIGRPNYLGSKFIRLTSDELWGFGYCSLKLTSKALFSYSNKLYCESVRLNRWAKMYHIHLQADDDACEKKAPQKHYRTITSNKVQ